MNVYVKRKINTKKWHSVTKKNSELFRSDSLYWIINYKASDEERSVRGIQESWRTKIPYDLEKCSTVTGKKGLNIEHKQQIERGGSKG